jgi:D-lactate dehydrogenase (cytochrome)
MDIVDYFIGSEGTLGVVTEIELILRKRPAFVLSMVAFFPSEADAVRFVILAREGRSGPKRSVDPAALEYFDAFSLGLLTQKRKQEGSSSSIPPFPESAGAAVYFEEETKEEDLDRLLLEYETMLTGCHASSDQAWCGMDRKELGKMAVFRHALPEVINTIIGQRQKQFPRLHKIGTDFVVPDRHLEDMLRFYRENLDKAGFEYAVFGHIGENHLHVNILPSDENALDRAKVLYQDFAVKAVSFGGTVSGEHGIGKIKKALLSCMYSEKDILEMKRVKQALDPGGVLNRGNLW